MSHDSSYLSIPIGVDDYKKLIDNKNMYVDKTLLIKEFWQDGAEVILTPRPRRFGKTLNLSMLRYFFEKTDQNTSYLFKKTNIWNYPEYRALQGQFPVIFLTFKDVKANSWESAYAEFAGIISEECKRLSPSSIVIEKMRTSDIDIFDRLMNKKAPEQELTQSLQFLSRLLHEQTGKKVIIFIDEYDAPIIQAYLKNYYEKMIMFMRSLLSKVLKTNLVLEKGFLTGITRIAKEDIFSGLNNLSVRTILDTKYSDKFGFTQEEVNQLLISYNLADKTDDIKRWYDGYVFGNTNMHNPWSLLKCIENEGKFDTYWANTSGNDLIKNIITNNSNKEIKKEIELLLQNYTLKDKKIDINVTLSDLNNNNQEPWSFLLFTGYLTAISHTVIDEDYYYTLAIPNTEIVKLYRGLVFQALNSSISFTKLKELMEAFIAGDRKVVEQYLQEFIANACSSHDVAKNDLERNIHMFVLGLLAGLSDRYIIQSKFSHSFSLFHDGGPMPMGATRKESGDGRYDIMIMPRNKPDPGILIEFKKAENKKTLAASAQKALEQIKSLEYKTQLKTFGYDGPIICYGIAAYGKHLMVNTEII